MGKARGRQVARIAVDALIVVVFVLLMVAALVAEASHEHLGLALFALMVALESVRVRKSLVC